MKLEIYEGVGQVKSVPLAEGATLTLGRVKTCDVVVNGANVSRNHAKVKVFDGIVTIENTSSSPQGTRVNGKQLAPLEPERVQSGDDLQFGRVAVRLVDAARLHRMLLEARI